jgi:SAM-dependent methyltransferase
MHAYQTHKRVLLGALDGIVLVIGAGNGVNFALYPTGIRWLGLEPDRRRRRRLARAAAGHGQPGTVLGAVAEQIPLADHSVAAVVSTIVLCSVRDQDRVLAEIRRVLRPGGAFVFLEHVAAPAGSWTRRAQRAWAPLSRRFDAGCDPSRETWVAIERAGFSSVDIRWFTRRPRFDIYSPHIAGRALA